MIKGFAIFRNVESDFNGATCRVTVQYVGIDVSQADGEIVIEGVSVDVNSLQLQTLVADAVQAKLISDYGFTFGGGDIIKTIGIGIV